MDSNSLPMVPDMAVFSKPVRYLVFGVLGTGVFVFALLILLGLVSTPTVTVEATVVDDAPSDAAVYPLSSFSEDSEVRVAVEEALRSGTASVEATTEEIRDDDVPATEFYVSHEGRVVHVTLRN
jgi:hypothetical protein